MTRHQSRQLDAMIRAGEVLGRGIRELERPHLQALADRLDLVPRRSTRELRHAVRRRLVRVEETS